MSSRGLTTGSRKTIKNTNKFSILTGSRDDTKKDWIPAYAGMT
ncbi:MAG: palindromic element RPE4 domain-containing protein [Rickettsia endosymbiont of Sceptobius lativentris]|nr:palindromic element RPE4 domain-containing protein [Rickettsia endosymbiont of Sceptobius lativentris]